MIKQKEIVSFNHYNGRREKAKLVYCMLSSIKDRAQDFDIISLFKAGPFSKEFALSESDKFLICCVLIEEKRENLIKELDLIEELGSSSVYYVYEPSKEKLRGLEIDHSFLSQNSAFHFSLIAYAMLHGIDWETVACIQRMQGLNREDSDCIEAKRETFGRFSEGNFLDDKLSKYCRKINEKYGLILDMGEIYVNFITNKDSWKENINKVYKDNPKIVTSYLSNMAQNFAMNLCYIHSDQVEKDDVWLNNNAKALRNIIEEVIHIIKAKRSIKKAEKHQLLSEFSQFMLVDLNACIDLINNKDKNILNEKQTSKLGHLIDFLRKNSVKSEQNSVRSTVGLFAPSNGSDSQEYIAAFPSSSRS